MMRYPNPQPGRTGWLDGAFVAEFLGMLFFQLLVGSSLGPARIATTFAAIMYATSFFSGGHLNPAVSLAAALSGHLGFMRAAFYIIAQAAGAILGAMLQVWLTPGLHFGSGSKAPGCFTPMSGLGGTSLYVWEALLTFLFVMVLYAAIFRPPGHGAVAPLAAGVALFSALSTAGDFTGYSPLNPAFTFATSLIFDCNWRYSWMYLLAQATGGAVAAGVAATAYGVGPNFQDDETRARLAAQGGGHGTGYGAGYAYGATDPGLRERLMEESGEPAGATVVRSTLA